MVKEKPTESDHLHLHMRIMGWLRLFKSFGPRVQIISDSDIVYKLRLELNLQCGLAAPPQDFSRQSLLETIGQHVILLVLCRSNERALTKALRQNFPGRKVISGTYDLAPASTKFPVVFQDIPINASKPENHQKPFVLLSTPGSDGEYLAKIMENAGLTPPTEYIGKSTIEWLKQSDTLSIPHFYDTICKLTPPGKSPAIHLQTDVLQTLINQGVLSWRTLTRWLKRVDARVALLTRQDKVFQAGLLAIFDGRAMRSVWTLSQMLRQNFPKNIYPRFDVANDYLKQNKAAESHLREALQGYPSLVSLTTEDLARNPLDALDRVCALTGDQPICPPEVPDYVDGYASLPTLLEHTYEYQRQLLDRIGIHAAR